MSRVRPLRRRVFYVAPVVADPCARHLESPAARNKVLGVVEALRTAGAQAYVVTTTGIDPGVAPRRPLAVSRKNHAVFVQVFGARSSAVLRRVSALLFLGLFVLRLVRRGDAVILYNAYPDYLLAALLCRLKGAVCVLDIEDWIPPQLTSALERVVRVSQPMLLRLCQPRQITVSQQLGKALELERFLPVYGVASFHAGDRRTPPFSGPVTRVLYGGSILHETGFDLFEAALADLVADPPEAPIDIVVSGTFDTSRMTALADRAGTGRNLSMTVAQDLSAEAYRALCDTMDVGLCLKLSNSVMGQTTFPSKVLEIAAKGMLLVSTPVSDVPLIFDDDSAVILATDDHRALADALRSAAANPGRAADRARRGEARVHALFDAQTVGRAILAFLDPAI